MKLSFSLKRTALVATSVFCVLVAAELLKGHTLRRALVFSLLWSTISTVIFAVTRIYYVRKNIDCPICAEAPK